jgi:hypothetical protein
LPHGLLHAFNTILYENEFQNPQISRKTLSLFTEQSTLREFNMTSTVLIKDFQSHVDEEKNQILQRKQKNVHFKNKPPLLFDPFNYYTFEEINSILELVSFKKTLYTVYGLPQAARPNNWAAIVG